MRLLNDVRTEQQRLAYLLGGNVEVHRRTGYWSGAMMGLAFMVATTLVVMWYLAQFTPVKM